MQTKFNQRQTEFSSRIFELSKRRPILCTLTDEESKTVIPCEYLSPYLELINYVLKPKVRDASTLYYETADSIGYKNKTSGLEIRRYPNFRNTNRIAECIIESEFESKGSFCSVGNDELIMGLEENGTNQEVNVVFS